MACYWSSLYGGKDICVFCCSSSSSQHWQPASGHLLLSVPQVSIAPSSAGIGTLSLLLVKVFISEGGQATEKWETAICSHCASLVPLKPTGHREASELRRASLFSLGFIFAFCWKQDRSGLICAVHLKSPFASKLHSLRAGRFANTEQAWIYILSVIGLRSSRKSGISLEDGRADLSSGVQYTVWSLKIS